MAVNTYSLEPFINPDIFCYTARFLEIRDVFILPQVCKTWSEFAEKTPEFWSVLNIIEGIPLVEGEKRNRKADFFTLYPITISGKRIRAVFGRVVGTIPCIRQKIFDSLNEKDPFEPEKLKKDTFRFIVDPNVIERPLDNTTPLVLNEEGDLIKMDRIQTAENALVPFSLRNIITLCSYPLDKKKGGVFSRVLKEAFEQCNSCPDQVGVYFLRREVVEITRNTPYSDQESQMQAQGFEVVSLRIRMLFDVIEIFEKRTCPDGNKPLTYVRTSNTVRFGAEDYQVAIGGLSIYGLNICHYYQYDNMYLAVVPSCSAEVLPAIGP